MIMTHKQHCAPFMRHIPHLPQALLLKLRMVVVKKQVMVYH